MASNQHYAPPAGLKTPPLSFAVRTGDLLFVSGMPGFDDNRGLPPTFEAQFGNVVRNLKRTLGDAGADFLLQQDRVCPFNRAENDRDLVSSIRQRARARHKKR